MRRLLPFVVFLALASPAQAAVPFEKQARQFWGEQDPSCGTPTYEVVDHRTAMELDAVASANPFNCVISLQRFYWEQRWTNAHCAVILHEYGHLLWLGHSDDGIMRAPPVVPQLCVDAFRPVCRRVRVRHAKKRVRRCRAPVFRFS